MMKKKKRKLSRLMRARLGTRSLARWAAVYVSCFQDTTGQPEWVINRLNKRRGEAFQRMQRAYWRSEFYVEANL